MPDIVLAMAITRTNLTAPLADLQLETPNYCRVVSQGPGNRTWRTTWVESPFAHGAYPTAMVMDKMIMPLTLRVVGADQSQLGSRIDELYEAFQQFKYEIVTTMDSIASRRWTCWAADIDPGEGGTFNSALLRARYQEITFQIPRHPIPVQGRA